MRKMICCAAMMLGCVLTANAQMEHMKMPSAAAGSQQAPSQALNMLLTIQEHDMMGVAKTMPAEKYDFAPSGLGIAGSKFDGVRTFAEQARHVAQANFYFASVVSGTQPTMDMGSIAKMKTKEEIVKALAGSYAALHAANATLTPQNAFEVVKSQDGDFTRSTMAAFAAAHAYDHYGQMVEYLRMNGLVPPSSAPQPK